MADWLYSSSEATAALPDDAATFRFHYALRHGTMKFGLYSPKREDTQGPHKQDELYFVISGSGKFIKDGEAARFRAHDAIFVEAGSDHRFFDFTEDFATWVVFWGPEGGEK